MSELPSGAVTFLFSDIEGSTRLVKALRDRYAQVLAEHRRLARVRDKTGCRRRADLTRLALQAGLVRSSPAAVRPAFGLGWPRCVSKA